MAPCPETTGAEPKPRRAVRDGWLLVAAVLALILVPWAIWGRQMDAWLSADQLRHWLAASVGRAWLVGLGLLCLDVLLPVPATVVMSVLGWAHGVWRGGLMAASGSLAAGLLAYGLARGLGRPAALWLAGADGLAKAERLFARQGGWLVALSRWTPVLPEAVACLAGLSKMPFGAFLLALACGSVPLGFAFAAVGALGQSSPAWAVALNIALPAALWAVAAWVRRRFGES